MYGVLINGGIVPGKGRPGGGKTSPYIFVGFSTSFIILPYNVSNAFLG